MENRSYALWVGSFTLLFLVTLVGWAIWFGQNHIRDLSIYFVVTKNSVSGLNQQALVRYRGVEVGHVQDIRFDRDGRTILIRIGVRPDTLITRTTYAKLEYQGLTGLAYIELNDKGATRLPLKTSPDNPGRIYMLPSLLQQVGDTGQVLLINLRQIADRMNRLLDNDNLQNLSQTLKNLSQATQQLLNLEQSLAPAVSQLPGTTRQLNQSLKDTDKMVKQFGSLGAELKQRMSVLDKVGLAGDRAAKAAKTVNDSTLPDLDRLISRLSRNATLLEEILKQQQEYPQQLIFGRPVDPPGPGEPGFQVREKK